MNNSIKLQLSSILHVPIQNYGDKFTFIVNNEEFHTNRLVADLLSPKISKQHLVDPTIDCYSINTHHLGNFRKILDLVKFEPQEISKDEISYIIEILENLENTTNYFTIHIEQEDQQETENITLNTYINRLKKSIEFPLFYEEQIKEEIENISSHFYEMKEDEMNVIQSFEYDIIESILKSHNLKIESEDELIEFINNLYLKDSKFSSLYAYVYFINVSSNKMKEFIENINFEDITIDIWKSLCVRLKEEIKTNLKSTENENSRYTNIQMHKDETEIKSFHSILYENQKFSGLINYLAKESDIKQELDISCSSIGTGGSRDPWSVISFDSSMTF